jgi:hypothetical protein
VIRVRDYAAIEQGLASQIEEFGYAAVDAAIDDKLFNPLSASEYFTLKALAHNTNNRRNRRK